MNWHRVIALTGSIVLLAAPLAAQRAEWIALDDPGMAMLEQLILRGDVRDPTPQVRPVRRGAVVDALTSPRCGHSDWCTSAVAALLARWTTPASRQSANVAGQVGAQGETAARRDLLWPAGEGRSVEGLADLTAAGQSGPAFSQLHLVYDPRALRDPDRGRATFGATRLAEGAIGIAVPAGGVSVEQLSRNWGPPDAEGDARSSSGYPEPGLAIDVGSRTLHLTVIAGKLDDTLAADSAPDRRWFGMHRLDVRPSSSFALGIWETAVGQGERRSGDDALNGLFNTLAFDQAFGRVQQRNSVIGADLTWQPWRTRWQAQLALDDWQSRAPPRYAFTLGAGGAVGARESWQILWSRVSALAYRTSDPREDYLYQGVGLGPIMADHDLWRIIAGIPLSATVLLRPEIAYLVQGEGSIQATFPDFDSLPNAVGFLEGTVQRTFRASVRADGRIGPLFLSTDVGVNVDRNADHVPGFSRTRFESRAAVSLGASHQWSSP